jgi:acetoacetyl-CoA synthetase
MVLVALQLKALHNDIGCSYEPNSWGERYHWYSSTGWVMWNAQVSGLLGGTTCVIFDGSPGGSKDKPDWGTLWRFAAETGVTSFGSGAAFYANCMKAGLICPPAATCRAYAGWAARARRCLPKCSNGARTEKLGRANIWWNNLSGGTDFAGAFIGGNRDLPLVPGVMQCRQLGAAVEAWNEQGQPVMDEVGELVCTQPIPSMPLFLWGDADGKRYFDMYPAGHGRQPGGGDGPPRWGRSGVMATGSSCSARAAASSTAAATPPSTATACAWAPARSTAPSRPCPRCWTAWWWTSNIWARTAICRCLWPCARRGAGCGAARAHQQGHPLGAVAPLCARRYLCRGRDTAHAQRQEAGAAHQEAAAGPALAKVVNKDAMANPGCLDWYEGFARE